MRAYYMCGNHESQRINQQMWRFRITAFVFVNLPERIYIKA